MNEDPDSVWVAASWVPRRLWDLSLWAQMMQLVESKIVFAQQRLKAAAI